MNRIMKFSALSALALTLVVWGCDSLNESALVGPAGSAPRGDLISIDTTTNDSTHYTLMVNASTFSYTQSKEIGALGGYMELGNYSVSVPAGAVLAPTTFTMTIQGDGYYSASYRATRKDAAGTEVDVGKQGFLLPVGVTMPYDSKKYRDPSNLRIGWLKNDSYTGEIEALPTAASKRTEKLSAAVGHFSAYAVVIPE